MGKTNWVVITPAALYTLKRYGSSTDAAIEAAALELSQVARAEGVPAPLVIQSIAGELLCSVGDLICHQGFHDTTSGVALARPEMAHADHTLVRRHVCLQG